MVHEVHGVANMRTRVAISKNIVISHLKLVIGHDRKGMQ